MFTIIMKLFGMIPDAKGDIESGFAILTRFVEMIKNILSFGIDHTLFYDICGLVLHNISIGKLNYSELIEKTSKITITALPRLV